MKSRLSKCRFQMRYKWIVKCNPPKNRFIKLVKNQPMKPPYIDLQVSTWLKDYQALFDYQAEADRYYKESFQINRNCKIYRHLATMRIAVQYDDDHKEMSMENIYICSVIFDQNHGRFRVQSADVSGVHPHPFLRDQYPDIFRNSYLVLRDIQKSQGYLLNIGNSIKLGKMEFVVIQIQDGQGRRILKETSFLQINEGVYKIGVEIKGQCKICLCDESTQSDPLISPCNCKGSCELVHVGCLKNWISSRVKREINGITISYNFSKLQCEICKKLLPKAVQYKNGVNMEMLAFERPNKPFIVLENTRDRYDQKQAGERLLYVVLSDEKHSVKLGRAHNCEISIHDHSVSRIHAEIRFERDRFVLRDLGSKFGTLVKFREEFQLGKRLRLQYGRTSFAFVMRTEPQKRLKDVKDMLTGKTYFQMRDYLALREAIEEEEEEH